MSDFGGLIRDAREKLGLSPHRVAELIGRASGTVKAWERGRTVPSDPFVVTSLAAVLGIDERVLFEAAGLTPPGHKEALTIEQELATIAPAKPSPPNPAGDVERSRVATGEQETVAVPVRREEPESDLGVAAPVEAVADFFQKGKDFFADAGAPVMDKLRSSSETRRQPRQTPARPQPPTPTGSYLDDPEERWSYRLRTLWTAAGLGALGVLLLWAGSRALDAFGETWDALLAGL